MASIDRLAKDISILCFKQSIFFIFVLVKKTNQCSFENVLCSGLELLEQTEKIKFFSLPLLIKFFFISLMFLFCNDL